MKDFTVKNSKRKMDIDKAVDRSNQEDTREEILILYPEQKFTPRQYGSMAVGGIYLKIFIREGETPEEAYERGWNFVCSRVNDQFQKIYSDYLSRLRQIDFWNAQPRDVNKDSW